MGPATATAPFAYGHSDGTIPCYAQLRTTHHLLYSFTTQVQVQATNVNDIDYEEAHARPKSTVAVSE